MWQTVKLGDVCKVERGSSPRPIQQFLTKNEGVNWIKIGDTEENGKYVNSTEQKITNIGAKKSRFVQKGDLILSNSMSFGRPYIMNIDGYIHDGWFVLRLGNDLDKEYMFYLLASSYVQRQFQSLAAGAIVRNISGDLVKKTQLLIPPLAEQQRIVEKLNAVSEIIENSKKQIEQYQALKSVLLVNELGAKNNDWQTVKLGDICTINNGGTPKSNEKTYWGGEIQWLTPKDMGKLNSCHVSQTERQITTLGLQNSSAKIIPENSVILSSRAPIGYVAINEVPMSFNQGCRGLVPNENIIVEYLYYFLFASKQLLNDLGTGATFKEISAKRLASIEFLLPSLAEQNRIVDKLSNVDKMIENKEKQIEQYQALLSVLLASELKWEAA